ncbi:MAG: T9SS type A sorting domain-containing protein [bacterium]|nr:T9SS type A sorting domain-containing protein [bacterium]
MYKFGKFLITLAVFALATNAWAAMPTLPISAGVEDASRSVALSAPPAQVDRDQSGRLDAIINVPADQPTIQAAINAASPGDVILVAAGIYVENLVVNKSLTINGAGVGLTTIYPAASDVGPCNAGSFQNSQVIVVSAHDVTISNLTVDGDNPSLTSGVSVNGADIDARNGIIESDGPWNNLVVHHTTVKNVFLRGIYARSSGSSFHIHHNTVQNVAACGGSIGIFNYGGAGLIEYNTVSYCNDAIAANWSRGTQFLNNVITNSGSGLHTDNNGGFGGVADLIQNNFVDDGAVNSYGIWVFFPYLNVVLDNNTVNNNDIGLFAWGGSGGQGQFTNNDVDGENRPGCLGIYVTVGSDAWLSYQSSVNSLLTGNTTANCSYGFAFDTDENGDFATTVSSSSYTYSGHTYDVYVSGVGAMSYSGLSGGTVWVQAPARIQDGINIANSSGSVTASDGTYPEALNIYKSLTLIGESQAGVVINASAFSDYGIDANGDFNFTFQNFTLDGPDAAITGNYGLKVSGDNATAAISNVTVIGTGKTGIDLNGLASGSITNCTSSGALSGNGLSLTDCSNFTINGLTTSGNAWGGAAVYTYGRYNTGGSNNVNFMGTLNISEARPIYWERVEWMSVRPPLTNLTVPPGAYPYVVGSALYPYLEAYMPSQAAAVAAATTQGVNGWAYDRALDFFHVTPPMQVQAALTASASTWAYEATANEVHLTAGLFEGFAVDGLSYTNVIGVGNSTIIRPTVLLATGVGHKYTPAMNVPVFVNNSTNVTLQSMVIEDGLGLTPGAGGADAIVFWNRASGAISNCSIVGTYTIAGSQTGQGLAVDASAPGTATLAVNNCTFNGFQKNAVDVVDGNYNLAGGGNITFNMTGGTIVGAGPTTAIAQNGVMLWSRAGGLVGGTINGVSISALNYTPAGTEATAMNMYNATGPTTTHNCILEAENPAYDPNAGHTWNNNCYSNFTTNPGYPGQYNVVGGGGNVDLNPNTNGCTDIGFVLSDDHIGCSGVCDNVNLYLTLNTPGIPNLQVILDLPAGFAADLPLIGAIVTPILAERDTNLIAAYAIKLNDSLVQVDMGFEPGQGYSTGDYTKYVACIPLISTAATGVHTITVNGTLWTDESNFDHSNALSVSAASIEVDCTVPVINTFVNSATCAFGSAAQMDNKFSATLTDANSLLDEAWVTFAPSGASIPLFGANVASPETLTFPTPGAQALAFYNALNEGCNTLTLHLTDSECNVATVFSLSNIGRDTTAPSLTVTTSIPANYCFSNDPLSPNYGGSYLDDYINITSELGANACMAATGTLTISYGMNSFPLPLDQPNYLSTDGEALALWGWMLPIVGGSNGAPSVFNVNASDCAGNTATMQPFTICVDTTKPQNAVTAFDARPAHLGVWLKWSWTAGLQAQEMRIYRSPLSGQYPSYSGDLWASEANYATTMPVPVGWTLVATQTALSGTTSAVYGSVNNRGDGPTTHVAGSDTYWLDADTNWVNGHGNAASYRDIYRYVTFVKDAGGNWSVGDTVEFLENADRSTNYWLGDWVTADVGAGNFNSSGRVNTADLNVLPPVYFTNTGTYHNIGPVNFENGTVGKSVPNPDGSGSVNFSDLVVFSFNYGVVAPVGESPSTEFGLEPDPAQYRPFGNLDEAPVVSLTTPTDASFDDGSEFTVTIGLTGNEGDVVKAVEAVLEYDDTRLEYVSSTTSAIATDGTLFTKAALVNNEAGKVGIVAAACGGYTTLYDDAVLGTVTFRVMREITSPCELSLVSVQMVDNTGAIRTTESDGISIQSASSIPTNYALHQNYPNPFNPTTNIQFDLVEAGHVTILVYNTLGQAVATVLNQPLEAGRHEVSFDASTLASGLYIYTIQVNGFSDLKKMVLIR